MTETVRVERHKKVKYVVNVPTPLGTPRKFEFLAPRNDKPTSHEVPLDMYEWMVNNTLAFERGELIVSRNQVNKDEVEEMIIDKEAYASNGKTNSEIAELLTKNGLPKIKKELELIKEKSSKQHVYDVFNDIKDTLVGSKIKLVEEWYNSDSKLED